MHAPDLVDHVATSTGLPAHDAARVVEDVVAYFTESTEDFVRRRHVELRTEGRKNDEIWRQLAEELSERVVVPPRLTERQLRRIVYG